MALHLVTTTDGSSALVDLRRVVLAAKGADPLAPVTVVVPTNGAGVLARRVLGRVGGIAAVQFLTAYRLAELLGGPALAGAGRRPVSTPVVSAAVLQELTASPGRFAPVHLHETTVAAAVRGYRELRGSMPAPDATSRSTDRRWQATSSDCTIRSADGSRATGTTKPTCSKRPARRSSRPEQPTSAPWWPTSRSGCRRPSRACCGNSPSGSMST